MFSGANLFFSSNWYYATFQCGRYNIFKRNNFLLPENMKKPSSQKLLIIDPNSFFQYCQSAQNQFYGNFMFHKIVSLPARMFLDLGLYRLGILKLRGTQSLHVYIKTTQCGEIIYKFVFESHWKSANLKFRFSKKATNFETISHLIWHLLIFVAFSWYPNFNTAR